MSGTARIRYGRTVVILGIASLLNDTASEIIYPLLPAFLTTVLGAGPAALGVIEGVAESTASLLKLASGWLSDRLGRRKGLVALGYGLAAAARPLIALAATVAQVLAVRFAGRVGKGLRTAPRDALLAASAPPEIRGRAFGFHRAMDHLGAVLGPLAAAAFLSFYPGEYRLLFLLGSVPGLLAVAAVLFGVTDRPVVSAPPTAAVPRTPLPSTLWRFVGAMFVFALGNSTDAFLLLRAQEAGVPTAHLPLLWVLLHGVKAASSVPGGRLSDAVGRRPVIVAGWVLYALVYLGFGRVAGPGEAWALFALYGVFFGLTEGTEKAFVADLVPPAQHGAAFGVYHLVVGVAALPASVVFGVVWQAHGAPAAFTMGAALAAAAAGLLCTIVPRVHAPTRA